MMTRCVSRVAASAQLKRFPDSGWRGWLALAVLLSSCSTAPPVQDLEEPVEAAPRISLVFIIHGDGDYSYHDALGVEHEADEVVLAQAQSIAERSPLAEVFLFHEIERRHVLFLFPRRDGRAYYYRNGRLLARQSYWRDQGDSRFEPEVRFYERFAGARSPDAVRLFFYSGHELPEFDGAGYDASYSKRRVTIGDLAEGVRDFAGESGRFDLLTLATCFGGTPHTIGALAPYARTIIASPDNLHLSFFDLEPLAELDVGTGDGELDAFASRFAHNAFERLTSDVQTTVSVVVYDTRKVSGYLDSVRGAYDRALAAASGMSSDSLEHCDCADDSTYSFPGMSDGLTVLYRAPRFGRMKQKRNHSGWECWRAEENFPAGGNAISEPGGSSKDPPKD